MKKISETLFWPVRPTATYVESFLNQSPPCMLHNNHTGIYVALQIPLAYPYLRAFALAVLLFTVYLY